MPWRLRASPPVSLLKKVFCFEGALSKHLWYVWRVTRWWGSKLFKQLIHLGCYWPTMEVDAASFTRMCQVCQVNSNIIHVLQLDWIFIYTLAILCLLGLINSSSRGQIWVLVATKCYTELVDAIALKWARGTALVNFICIMSFFILTFTSFYSNNGSPFD